MIKEIKSEAWHVLVISLMMIWTIMICDINQRIESHDFCQNWKYNTACPIPTGFEDAMVRP